MRHAGTEVSDADVRLLGPAQVGLGDEHVTHWQHAQTWIKAEYNHGENIAHTAVPVLNTMEN